MAEPTPEQEWQKRVDEVGVDRAAWSEVARDVNLDRDGQGAATSGPICDS